MHGPAKAFPLLPLDCADEIIYNKRSEHDPWGVPTVTYPGGTLITNPEHIGNLNPFRYRGYYYDKETGWYYLQSRYYDPTLRRFLNADVMDVLTVDMMTVADKNLFAYCNGNPVMYSDPSGRWSPTIEIIAKIVVGVAIVGAAAAIIAGTGGAAAPIVLGAALGAATGGYFNEKAGGSFTSGAIGGAISGTVQGLAGNAYRAIGTLFGGSIGSGLGTFVAEALDKVVGVSQKSWGQIGIDTAKSGAVALVTSSLTANVVAGANILDDYKGAIGEGLKPIMKTWSPVFSDMTQAFFSAIDDACTYLWLLRE